MAADWHKVSSAYPNSNRRSSPRSHSVNWYSCPDQLAWVHSRLTTCLRLLAVDQLSSYKSNVLSLDQCSYWTKAQFSRLQYQLDRLFANVSHRTRRLSSLVIPCRWRHSRLTSIYNHGLGQHSVITPGRHSEWVSEWVSV